jgi:hypothetical protein
MAIEHLVCSGWLEERRLASGRDARLAVLVGGIKEKEQLAMKEW